MTDPEAAEPAWSVTAHRATSPDGVDTVHVVVVGAIDPNNAPELRAVWTAAVRPRVPQCLELDLTGVVFCGSHGVRSLVEAADACEAAGITMRVIASPPVRRVAAITHLADVLHIED
ncbi:STAS domain-containing protein [Amycolatopsis sp. NPDC098790]|uniref:STAS domain-containing protein n=1 Tax=Amycolatopsis sp. NPDC098790 TaxID=3363939 RepID=UPI003804DF6F